MLHEAIRNDDFKRNIVATLFRMATTLQRCVSLKIAVANRPVQHHIYWFRNLRLQGLKIV